ncbi:MAG: hypothetical protein OEV44_01965 [Spirochaetota bacterium]|nr:hypothetical protein [Spirochaetota bacterium]
MLRKGYVILTVILLLQAFGFSHDVKKEEYKFSLDQTKQWLEKRGFNYSKEALQNLEYLNLKYSEITDEEMVNLRPLTNLKILDLTFNKITDSGLVHLTPLAKLKKLYISKNSVTDECLVHIRSLKSLRELSIGYTQISKIASLSELPNLRIIYIWNTSIGDEEIKALKASIPKLTIVN